MDDVKPASACAVPLLFAATSKSNVCPRRGNEDSCCGYDKHIFEENEVLEQIIYGDWNGVRCSTPSSMRSATYAQMLEGIR
jgi:hypothetical protein